MHNSKFVPVANKSGSIEDDWYKQNENNGQITSGQESSKAVTIERSWYKEKEEDSSHVFSGVLFIGLIIIAKILVMF